MHPATPPGRARSRPLRAILIGTGGHGADWCRRILPPFLERKLIEVAAAVDIVPAVLANAERHLGVPEERCYTSLDPALTENPADFCIVVTPPATHESIINRIIPYGLHLLCEKPIADTLDACVRVVAAAARNNIKLGITMNHRFDQDKTTLRQQIASMRHGPLDYLVYRFTCDFRRFPTFGKTQHEMAHPLLLDAAVHHLDIISDMVGAACDTVYAQTWNPSWAEFSGDSQALVMLSFSNGCRAMYEGALANASATNCWADEYIRAECRDATLVLNHRKLEMFPHARGQVNSSPEGRGIQIPLIQRPAWLHAWLIEQFIAWLDGGPPMATAAARNLESIATVFAAITSGRSGQPVQVRTLLDDSYVRYGHPDAVSPPQGKETVRE